MEKNQLIGFVLIFFILIWWSMMRKPPMPMEGELSDPNIETVENIEADNSTTVATQPAINDSIQQQQLQSSFASFSASAAGTESFEILENDKLRLKFSNKGGKIVSAVIKDHFMFRKNEAGEEVKIPVELLSNPKNRFEYIINLNNKSISTEDLYFTTEKRGNSLIFSAKTVDGGSFNQTYQLDEDSYNIGYTVDVNNLNNSITRTGTPITFNWINILDVLETNVMFEERYSTVYFKDKEDDSDYCNCMSDSQEENLDGNIEWVSHTHQFFNSSIVTTDKTFGGGVFTTEMLDNEMELKQIGTSLTVPYSHGTNESMAMNMYIGPNDYDDLHAYGNDLEEIIPFGRSIFGDINRVIIRPSFDFLTKFIGSKGLVIIVLIFIIKMLLYPLYYKMLYSQAKMGALKPEIAQLKDKFKDDAQKVQMETMKMYREYGVSPLGGCLPMVVQIPIWYALFRFFPASITFRQESFLWANDLSSFDSIMTLPFTIPAFGSHLSLFTILWALSTVVYTYYNMKHMDTSANPAMKYVQYAMPLMFLVYFNNYASGLTCYMFFSQLMNVVQTVVTKKYVFNDDKIRAELQKNKETPKKKGKFQARLEEAMKQQQMQAKKKNKK